MADDNESTKAEQLWAVWLTPFKAIERLIEAGLEDREHAVNWLVARLQSGAMRSAGLRYRLADESKDIETSICLWRFTIWKNVHQIDWKHDFWISGDYIDGDDMLAGMEIVPFGASLDSIRFDPMCIDEFAAQHSKPVPMISASTTAPKHAGGRPPKPFWDDLWAAIAGQLYNGDLKPERQADIERAMLDWLSANDKDAGETAIRAKAKLLWSAINSEVEN